MKNITFIAALLICITSQFFTKPLYSQTDIYSNTISGVLTYAGSPYIIHNDLLYVDNDYTLTIMPGVTLKFNSGAIFRVNYFGALNALGKPDSLIVFTSNESNPAKGDWNGIVIHAGLWDSHLEDASYLKHCLIEYATTGICFEAFASGCDEWNNYSEIDSSIIRNNSLTGIQCKGFGFSTLGCSPDSYGYCHPKITNCKIYNNNSYGIECVASEGYHSHGKINSEIYNNVIYNNGSGIYCHGNDIVEPKIINNTIVNNQECGIKSSHKNFNKNNFNIVNNIIVGNEIGIQNKADTIVYTSYNDIWGNTVNYEGNFENINSISVNPLFIDTTNFNFNLLQNSPCIDAGDPNEPFDPNNTIADIGALYYHQESLVAEFTANPTEGLYPLTVNFVNESSGEYISSFWDFGDGATSTVTNPVHVYESNGYFDVSLLISNEFDADTIRVDSLIYVYPEPTVEISGGGVYCTGDSTSLIFSFTGTPPWNITYSDGKSQYTFTIFFPNDTIWVKEGGNYEIISLADVNTSGTQLGEVINVLFNSTYESQEYVSICEGEDYLGLTEEGEHIRGFESINGCDSTVTTNLTVHEIPNPDFTYDADTLTSIGTYTSYQWYVQNGILEGATSRQFVIENSGTYYLEVIDDNGCSAMSDGVNLIKTGINDFTKDQLNLVVIPNPNDGKFRIRFENGNSGKYQVQIINELGQVQLEKEVYLTSNVYEEDFQLSHLSKGNYFVKVSDGTFTNTKKIILK